MPKDEPRRTGDHNSLQAGALAWRKNKGPALEMRYDHVNAELLRSAIQVVTNSGAAIMFGLTRDGGAYSLCVLAGNEKVKEYPSSVATLEDILKSLVEYFV